MRYIGSLSYYLVGPSMVLHAYHVHPISVDRSTTSKQSSALGITTNIPLLVRSHALIYQSIDLEQYTTYNQTRVNERQQQQQQHNDASSSSYFASTLPTTPSTTCGVTSLHVMPFSPWKPADSLYHDGYVVSSDNIQLVCVGTKYGELVVLPLEVKNTTWSISCHVPVKVLSHQPAGIGKLRFPNYCTTSIVANNEIMLLVGSGDRYVQIWQPNIPSNEMDSHRSWSMTQRLGPHTGWVKSLAVLPSMVPTAMNHTGTTGSGSINPLESDNILHRILSIGCNRIEYWIYNKSIGPRSKNETSAWTHMSTTSIASTSPNALVGTTTKSPNSSIGTVCTLSSDLLCLEVCTVVTSSSSSNHRATIVAVGGVDGRIHFYWDRQNPIQYGLQHLITITAHQGRVNGLSYDETRQRLISGSHDGTIHCWSVQWNHMDHNESITIDQIASYEFNDGVRVTALLYFSSQRSNGTSMNIIAGTQVGSIHLLAITDKMESGKCEILATSDIYIDNYDGEARGNGPIINAFCHLRVKTISNTSLNTFVVAHSQCMGIIQVLGEAEDHTL